MSELLNPLQLAAKLRKHPSEITKLINDNKITAHKIGLRSGLYDSDEVKAALDRIEAGKPEQK